MGVSPLTVIVSATPPTFRSALTVAVNAPVSSMPSRLNRAEAGQRERHVVRARTEIDDAVQAGAVGRRRPHLFDEDRAGRFNGNAREHRARGISHDTRDGGLTECEGRSENETREP